MVFKETRAKIEKGWTTTKKLLAMMSVWGLIFSLVTIGRLGIAFDYDDVLVHSERAFEKAGVSVQQARSPQFWAIVNNSYDLESRKIIPYALAHVFRAFGFRLLILAEREASDGDALKKEWRGLAPRGFVFTGSDPATKHLHLQDGRFILYFASGDRDLHEARKAGVYAVRVKRGKKAVRRDEYHPGTMGELVIPFSDI